MSVLKALGDVGGTGQAEKAYGKIAYSLNLAFDSDGCLLADQRLF